jgi:hypothetical protein
MAKKYILKDGVVLHPFGVNSKIDNSNITDTIAEMLLKKGRAKQSDFIDSKIDMVVKTIKRKYKKFKNKR